MKENIPNIGEIRLLRLQRNAPLLLPVEPSFSMGAEDTAYFSMFDYFGLV